MFELISRGHILAESPGLNSFSTSLFWVDIEDSSLFTWVRGGEPQKHDLRGRGVTSAHPMGATKYLITGKNSIYLFNLLGPIEVLWESDCEDWRFNDSFLLSQGNLLIGTKSLTPGLPARLGLSLASELRWLSPELSLANGLEQDTRLGVTYIADSLIGNVWKTKAVYPEDLLSPDLTLEPFISGLSGEPDGILLDRFGNLFVAIWGRGQIRKYDPLGKEIGRLQLGTTHLTSLCWADGQQRSLLVTSANSGDEIESRFPMQGGDVILLKSLF